VCRVAGLFKDFWTDLSGMVFDLEFGLFMRTPDGLLYPNPASVFIHGVEHLRLFEFVGRILGKVRPHPMPTSRIPPSHQIPSLILCTHACLALFRCAGHV
jgi:hypothetical protein